VLKQRHQFFVSLLCGADGLVVTLACYAAWVVRRLAIEKSWPTTPPNASHWWGVAEPWVREPLAPVCLPIMLLTLWNFGLYRPRRDRGMMAEHGQVFRASLAGIIALVVLVAALGTEFVGGWSGGGQIFIFGLPLDASRVQLGALAIILPNLLAIHRVLFRSALQSIRRRGWNLRHVAVIGVGRLGRIVCRTLDRNSWTGIHVAYFLSHQDHNHGPGECVSRPVLGGLADLEKVFEKNKPDAVYLAIPTQRTSVIPGVLKRLERFAVDVRIVPDVHPRYVPQTMQVGMLEGMPILSVRESPLNGLGGVVKRTLDVFGSAAALVVFSPLMLALAGVVRLTSPGPVIFRQRRVSLGGETFNIYKFRTMYHAEDEQRAPARLTKRNDPRITPVGRWLRRTSLDELPQLFNVLLGDMSLVGPRPERPELIERFRDDWRGYMLRQHVKAGITGWAQVNGLRGDTSIRKRLQHDLFYIRHWSLGFDFKILWLTLFRGFVHRNAH
jgi:Undecaprenyl-phosphate glucose phosphotransferase